MRRLRFGLAFDGRSLERWHLDCLDRLEPIADLAVLIPLTPESTVASNTDCSRALRRYARRLQAAWQIDVAERFEAIPRSSVTELPAAGASDTLDFVLRLGPGPVPADLASRTRHGLWYFEHEAEGQSLPFLREVYAGADVTHAALVTLAPERASPTILEEGYFPTQKRSYVASRELILRSAAAWPARVCEQLRVGSDLRRAAPVLPAAAARGTHKMRLLRLRLAFARRRCRLAWERFFRHPQWNIGVLRAPVASLLLPDAYAQARVEWFPLQGRERFLADPFGVVRDGTVHVICESFDYQEARGAISTLAYTEPGFSPRVEQVLALPTHMSYPFLVEAPEGLYCIPETAESGEVALYRCDEFPHRWSKAGVLVDGLAGVDPTVFEHEGRWWLTCTRKGPYEDVELWVWHASQLFGPWTPHVCNPVKTDVRSSRPAGPLFRHHGSLYRPTQDCSQTYGGRISLQRVKSLTPTEFEEEPVALLQSSPRSAFPHGPHTLTVVGDVVLVDGRRTVFVWAALRAFLRIWARDLGRRLPRPR